MKIYIVRAHEYDKYINIKAFKNVHKAKGLVAELDSLVEEFNSKYPAVSPEELQNYKYYSYFSNSNVTFDIEELELEE